MTKRRLVPIILLGAVLVGAVPPALADEGDPVARFEQSVDEETGETIWDPWAGFLDVRDDDDRTAQVRGFEGLGARVTIPAGTHRGTGGLARLEPAADEAWIRYYLRLDTWMATFNGKLPGLAGLYGSSARGCIPSAPGNPGWSARTMFQATGTNGAAGDDVRLGTYLYHLGQAGDCGDQILWDPGIVEQDRWYCVEEHVVLNTLGSADGMVEAWVDGEPVLRWPELAFRRADEADVGVRHLWANVYFGGTVVNATDLVASLDEMVVSRSGRVGCPDPFSDDDDSLFEAELYELYARGVLYGCAEGRSCPDDSLTRAQLAAFLQRALGLPNGPDAFSDDDGHWAEVPINALAAAGLTAGCGPDSYCPDREVTRAEMAVFLVRAFGLSGGGEVFTSDGDHWARSETEALAAAGITNGCSPTSFCPRSLITRGQMAALLRRALGFSIPPATLGYAGQDRIGQLIDERFDDTGESLPALD